MRALATVIGFMLLTYAARADTPPPITCQARKGDGSGWSWREIDGKRCWYKGRRSINKKLLRWPKAKAEERASKSPPREKRPRAPPPLDWPATPTVHPKPLSFEERWCASCIKGDE